MGKNRQESGATSSTDTSTGSTPATDPTAQQQQQPAPTGQLEAPPGDDAVSNPVIINR